MRTEEVYCALGDFRKLDALGGVGFNTALAQVFEKTADGNEIIVLRFFLERCISSLMHTCFLPVEPQAERAHHLVGNIIWLFRPARRQKAREVVLVVLNSFQTSPALNLQILQKLPCKRAEGGGGNILRHTKSIQLTTNN